jgi:hypothetical protein
MYFGRSLPSFQDLLRIRLGVGTASSAPRLTALSRLSAADMLEEMSESSGDAVVAPPTIVAVTMVPSITMLVSHAMWSTWARLAIGHERDARMARTEGLKSRAPDAYVPEYEGALQAVTQAAFALDGWYGATHAMLYNGRERQPRSGMSGGQLLESLRRAVGKNTLESGSLIEDVTWLFPSRGAAVHHEPRATTGSKHPLASGIVPEEYALFKAEEARRAINMLRAVFEGCLAAPTPTLQAWSEQFGGVLSELLDQMPPL